MKIITRLIIVCLSILITVSSIDAHSGGLDKTGGHLNHKTGEYHYHQKKSAASLQASSSVATSEQLPNQTTSSRDAKVNEYFRSANENVGALDCKQIKHERSVPEATKSAVRQRDGNKCVICGSTVKLEVDHRRALMNGVNEHPNRATL